MRSHYCADLDEKDIGREVKLCGWCNTYRDHGGIVFIDLRDRSGLVQLVFDPKDFEQSHKIASEVRDEYVLIAKQYILYCNNNILEKNAGVVKTIFKLENNILKFSDVTVEK